MVRAVNGPGEIRTPNPEVKSLQLYPVELPARVPRLGRLALR